MITNKLGFAGTQELREVTKVNTRKVDGMQNTKAWKYQTGLFGFNLLGSWKPLEPFDEAKEMTRATP